MSIKDLEKSYIPMSEQSFLILSGLTQENHGYGLMQYANEITGGRITLGAGTTYTILYKMENDGLIEFIGESERKKVYVITKLGMEILESECRRLIQLAEIAALRISNTL